MSRRSSPSTRNQSDSESSDSGLDTMSTSTGNSFPSDYMDLDEFLSVQTRNGPENQAVPKSCESAQNQLLNCPVRAEAVGNKTNSADLGSDGTTAAGAVNNVLSSLMLSKASSSPLKADPNFLQLLQAGNSQPAAATKAIIQWCKSVGVPQQVEEDVQEAENPHPVKTTLRRRRNARYVYNPLPISKKADRRFVSSAEKDEKYWERRIKNNVAAKRSRDMRRQKEIEVSEKFKMLERENSHLKDEVQRLRMKAVELEKKLAHFQGSNM